VIIRVILREAKRRRISDENSVEILHSYLSVGSGQAVQNDSFDAFYDSIKIYILRKSPMLISTKKSSRRERCPVVEKI